MKLIFLIITLLLSNINLSYACNAEVILTMRDKVIVNESIVKLADVVEMFSGDARYINKIKSMNVLNLGNTVHYKRIDQDVLSSIIRSKIGGVNVVFNGSNNTVVKVKTQKINIDDIVNEITDDISQLIAPITEDYTVKYISKIKNFSIPAGLVSYKYKLPSSVIKKRVSVWTDIYVNSMPYKSIPLWFDIKVLDDVAVATTKLKAGKNLNLNDFALEKKDLTLLDKDVLKSKDVKNLRVTKSILPGEVLSYSLLGEIPLVSRGQKVKVISSYGNVSIFVKGYALDDGDLGESVRVKRNGTKRIFNAVVEKQGLVSAIGS